jgi:hypothetical protein
MSKATLSVSPTVFYALAAATVITLFLSAYLFFTNQSYVHQNRELIIQNDSILSVNLACTT